MMNSEDADEMTAWITKFTNSLADDNPARIISDFSNILENGDDILETLRDLLKYCTNNYEHFRKKQ